MLQGARGNSHVFPRRLTLQDSMMLYVQFTMEKYAGLMLNKFLACRLGFWCMSVVIGMYPSKLLNMHYPRICRWSAVRYRLLSVCVLLVLGNRD